MRLRWPAFAIVFGALAVACAKNPRQDYEKQQAFNFLFEEHPFHFYCRDRPPKPLKPGESSFEVGGSPQAPFAVTRLDSLDLPKANAPTLTVVTEPANILEISIQGTDEENWRLQYCAQGEGDSVDEARGYLDKVSISRVGNFVTLAGGGSNPNSVERGYFVGGRGELIANAPANAPVTIHSTFGAISVHDMAGPVRVSTAHARISVLNTSGTVDAQGYVVDFAGAKGTVSLNATAEANVKINGLQFQGTLSAYASREVRILVPRGFQGPIEAVVAQPKNLICRADFCAGMQKTKAGGSYSFKYMKAGSVPADRVYLHSEISNVVIDNAP